MTPEERLIEDLLDMQDAAAEAIGFVEGFTFEQFHPDLKTQRAVAMTFVLLGATASRILSRFPNFTTEQSGVARSKIKGLRNVVVNEYDAIDWRLVWNTIQHDLPTLIAEIGQIRHPRIQGE